MSASAAAEPDRRTALKAANRHAIIEAAVRLVGERGLSGLTVDELAVRADVSRRTVFNHFASIDEIVPAAFAEALGVLVDTFAATAEATPVGEGTAQSTFAELAEVLRTADLVTGLSHLLGLLGSVDEEDPRVRAWVQEALAVTSDRFAAEVVRRHPTADPLDTAILVSALISALGVVAEHWWVRTGASDDAASRALWSELLERVLTALGDGYAPSSSS